MWPFLCWGTSLLYPVCWAFLSRANVESCQCILCIYWDYHMIFSSILLMWCIAFAGGCMLSSVVKGWELFLQDQEQENAHSHLCFSTQGGKSCQSSQARRERKGMWPPREGVTLSLFADDAFLYAENPKDSTKTLLELIREFGRVADTKPSVLLTAL